MAQEKILQSIYVVWGKCVVITVSLVHREKNSRNKVLSKATVSVNITSSETILTAGETSSSPKGEKKSSKHLKIDKLFKVN